MKISFLEAVDRYTILLIKKLHKLDCGAEFKELREEMKGVDSVIITQFLSINKKMWALEDEISATQDLTEIGRLYLELRELTKERAKLKRDPKKY